MKPTHSGIAVALALAVVIVIFILPELSPWGAAAQSEQVQITTNAEAQPSTMEITQLQAVDEVVGTGAVAAAGDSVTVNYVGALTNGTVFDASANHGTSGFTFILGAGQVIKGWDQGIVGMKVGGKRRLLIPAELAYGSQAVGNIIPANSALIFEVELLKVQKSDR